MASVFIEKENRTISEVGEIRSFLEPFGIWYEQWPVEGRLPENPSNDQILETYQPEINRLKEQGGYQTADVINVDRTTPGLDDMLKKFNKEHTHSEDEVRFTVSGAGLFHLNPENGPVFAVRVEAGDLINVPTGTRHWFNLCEDRHIRCIRLFEDPSGWTPEYMENGVHNEYQPLCFGPPTADGTPRVNSFIQP